MEGPEIKSAEAVIDNGKYGKRTIRFEAGRLAQQAQGSAAVYLDGETMLFSATSASKQPKDQFVDRFDGGIRQDDVQRQHAPTSPAATAWPKSGEGMEKGGRTRRGRRPFRQGQSSRLL